MALLSLVSILTSLVPICFSANFLISCKDVASHYHGTIKFSSVNLDSPGSLILEADAMQPLVHVDGVLPGHHLHRMSSKNIRMGSVSMWTYNHYSLCTFGSGLVHSPLPWWRPSSPYEAFRFCNNHSQSTRGHLKCNLSRISRPVQLLQHQRKDSLSIILDYDCIKTSPNPNTN